MARHAYPRQVTDAARLLGQLIRQARVERGWTVHELAERAGVTPPTIGKVERGDPSVKLGTAFDVAVLLGVPLFDPEPSRLEAEIRRNDDRLRLLPHAARRRDGVDDDF